MKKLDELRADYEAACDAWYAARATWYTIRADAWIADAAWDAVDAAADAYKKELERCQNLKNLKN